MSKRNKTRLRKVSKRNKTRLRKVSKRNKTRLRKVSKRNKTKNIQTGGETKLDILEKVNRYIELYKKGDLTDQENNEIQQLYSDFKKLNISDENLSKFVNFYDYLNNLDEYVNSKNRVRELELELNKKGGIELYPGLKLYGLQYCVKEKYRILGKIESKLSKLYEFKDKLDFLYKSFNNDSIKDVLRFTIVIDIGTVGGGTISGETKWTPVNQTKYLGKLQEIGRKLQKKGLTLHPQHWDPNGVDTELLTGYKFLQTSSKPTTTKSPPDEEFYEPVTSSTPQTEKDSREVHHISYNGIKPEYIIKFLDQDGDDNLSLVELTDKFLSNLPAINDIFTIIDGDGDGNLSNDELMQGINRCLDIINNKAEGDKNSAMEFIKLLNIISVEFLKNEYAKDLFNKALEGFKEMVRIFREIKLESFSESMQGGTNIKSINRWKTSEAYKGINVVYLLELQNKKKVPVEIQFHTPESFKKKQEMHDLYETNQDYIRNHEKNNIELLLEFNKLPTPLPPDDYDDIIDENKKLLGIE